MPLNDKHKAILITFFISGSLMFAMFSVHIKKKNILIAESYYAIEPEELLEEIFEAQNEQKNNIRPETNKAFNEAKDYKPFDKAYKLIEPPKDYENPLLGKDYSELENSKQNINTIEEISDDEALNFDKTKALLKNQQSSKENANKNSTISYSLKNRTAIFLPPPIYLCEQSGKIVINITVNSEGKVIDAYVNNTSNSSNECLLDHAIEYAKKSRFSQDQSKKSQIGSITFYFIGKH